jgi:hypothetical protein
MNDPEIFRKYMPKMTMALVIEASKLALASHDEASAMLLNHLVLSLQLDDIDLENDAVLLMFCKAVLCDSESPRDQPLDRLTRLSGVRPDISRCFNWILRTQGALTRKALAAIGEPE